MSAWNIYHKDGSKLTDVNGEQITVHGLEYSDSWMGECFLTINFKHEVPINFQIGDYIVYRGERFELNYEPGKDKQARPDTYGEGFVYDSVKFNALQDELARAEFLDVVLNDNELHYTALPKFPFYVQTLDDLLDRIQACLNEQIGAGLWKIYSRNKDRSVQRGALESEWMSMYGEGTIDNVIESMSITVDSQTCWQALALVNEKWDINFIVRGRNVYVGTTGIQANHIFKYGLGNGLYEIVQNADSDQSVVTRLRAYGSEKNLPSHYYADLGVKYVANITKVVGASTNVELELDVDYIETYFKNKRNYVVSGESQEQSLGWVLQVTFDFQTVITGYVTQAYDSKKCRFYSELKGTQTDTGDEESKEKLDAFIAQVKAGNTKMYITSGLNKRGIPSSMKEYAKNLPNNMSINRLMLPGFPHVSLSDFYNSLTNEEKKYVNPTGRQHKFSTDPHRPYIDSINIEQIGLRSTSQFFETDDKTNGVIEIYPTIEEMEIGGVRVDEIDDGVAPDDDGRFGDNDVDIYLKKAIDFDINDLKDDDFSISMKDGMCGGRTFKVVSSTKIDGRWRLTIERVKDDALELWFPYKDYPIKKGDHFVLTGITLPDSYVNAASLKLLKYAIAFIDKNDYTRYVYQPKVDEIFMARQHDQAQADDTGVIKSLHDTLKAGDLMEFEDTDLRIGGTISIDQLTIKEDDGKIPTYDITLREDKEVGTIQKIQQQISSLQSGNGGTGAGLTTTQVKNQVAAEGSKYFVSKITDDIAKGTVTWEKVQKLLKGLDIGDNKGAWSADGTLSLFRLLTNNFDSGPYGHGAQIDEKGDMEVNSIYARQFISAPKFVFNEISVTKAEQWNTNGYGTIESVDVKNRTITLHLEENDYGSLQVGDICRGLYADIDNAHGADKIEEGALDDCNFVQHKGFFSTYFYVMHIITNEKGKFVFQYGKKSAVTPDPCAYMDFAQYGSFTDDKRQSSMYFSSRGNSFIEVLDGVNTWEVQSQNRVARYGWLGGLALVKKDGSIVRPEGNGIYVQDNIYFGGNINYLQGLSGLDDLREEAKAYDVSLSQYQSVITVDDMGNVINGLYTEDEAKTTKQYRISTAVFVRKGMDILLEEDGNTEDVTAGHYRVHAVSEDCEVMVQNSTIFVTAIRNIKDGVAGTNDDANFDFDAMRKATDAMVTIVVELEGKTSKMVQMPIRIQHDTLPFMVCDLSNESASVAWNTKTAKYIGLPIKTKVSLMYHNEPWTISSLNISKVAGLKTSMSIEGKAKVITIDADNLTDDTLAQVTKMNITVVGRYAGANYEYTRELTILKSSDTVVYELIPSADSIVVDKDGGTSVNFVSCDVYATSSDDKRYKLTTLPAGISLKYGKSENATKDLALGAGVDVTSDDKMVTFALYDSNNNILDKESVPVLAYGKDGKGIEYIFKLQNSAPSNPTPSDYATNAEYQRTDKEFVPSGWTDNPTGVDAVNQYEWVSKRVSTNGHWGPFSAPAEYAHYGKHAPKAKSSDDIVTIPTDSNGYALLAFSEEVGFSLLVDGHECNISSIQRYSSTLSNVSCSISGNTASISCAEGAKLGITSQTVVFKVTGTLDDGSSYSDYVTVKVVPNVTGSDGDGYEYIYYLSSSSSASSIPTPRRQNGILQDNWQDDPMAPTVDKQYVYVAYKKGVVGSNGTFSAPKLFNRYPKSIAKQETKFYAHSSLTPKPSVDTIWNSGSTSMPKDFSDDKPWLWKIIRTTYTDGTTDDVVSCEGYKAKDGIGITSVNTWYGLSKSMTSQPSSFTYNTLSKVVIETHANDYVWSADKVTYTNNDEAFTGIYCIGKCSDLASVTEEYGTSLSADSKPSDNSWSGKYPENAPKGTYIWSRDKITWKDGTITTSAAQLIGYIATDGKHAPKASSTDDIVTIPTDSNGMALAEFSEDIHFSLRVNGRDCNVSQVVRDRANTTNVSYYISGNTASISCAEGARLGMVAQTIVFKVTGTLDGSTYIDYVTVKIVPNVTGADGDGYEYIYYQSNYLHNNFSAPNRTNGKLTDGWKDDLMAPTVDKRYVFVAYKRGELGSDGEFSMPQLFNRYPKSIVSQETKFIAWDSLTHGPDANYIWNNGSTTMPTDYSDDKPWLWKVVRTNYTEDAPEYTVSCEGYKAKDGHSLLVGYQSSASEPSALPVLKTLAEYDKAQDNIGNGWTKTAPATGGKSILLGGKITTDEISDRYNSSTSAWGTEESEILLDGIKQKKTFYKTPSSLGNNGKCIRRIKVVNHFRDSYLRVMMKSYSEANYDLVCISRLYLPSEVIDDKGNQLKTDDEYLSKSKYAYEVSGDGQSLVAELSMPDAGEYYFFIGYFKDGSNDSYGDYGLFAWQSMIALTESLWRTDGTVDDASNITWSKAMPMQAEAIVMERAYIATANDTSVPAKPYRTNGILQGGWTAKRLAVSSTNRFIWESVRAGKHGTDSVQDDWSQPVVVANFAEAGKMGKNGCIVRNSEGWKSGATYHNDSALTKEQKYIDLIYIEDNNANDGWSIYQCNVTHTATGSSFDPSAVDSDKNKLWTKLSDAGPMYSPLIVAKNAVLKFAQGQQFNLMEGNNIFGSFRWVKNDADYAFWIGGTSGAVATTSITKGGKLKTTNADITGKITATSGQIGGFKLEDNNLVCSNARLAIGEERNNFTRMVVLDAKSFTYDSYNFALSVVNYGIVTQSSTTQAGIHINVGASNASVQYPGIVMENGTFVGFRVPIVPLYYSMDLSNNASIYASGMCIRCNNSSNITITLPTSAKGAKTGDVFRVIRAGTGDVTIKAPAGVSYRTSNGKTGEFTSTRKNEQIHLIFDGDTWFSECSAG